MQKLDRTISKHIGYGISAHISNEEYNFKLKRKKQAEVKTEKVC